MSESCLGCGISRTRRNGRVTPSGCWICEDCDFIADDDPPETIPPRIRLTVEPTCDHGQPLSTASTTCPACCEIADHRETIEELEREERRRRKVQRAARKHSDHLLIVYDEKDWSRVENYLWHPQIEACPRCFRVAHVGECRP